MTKALFSANQSMNFYQSPDDERIVSGQSAKGQSNFFLMFN